MSNTLRLRYWLINWGIVLGLASYGFLTGHSDRLEDRWWPLWDCGPPALGLLGSFVIGLIAARKAIRGRQILLHISVAAVTKMMAYPCLTIGLGYLLKYTLTDFRVHHRTRFMPVGLFFTLLGLALDSIAHLHLNSELSRNTRNQISG